MAKFCYTSLLLAAEKLPRLPSASRDIYVSDCISHEQPIAKSTIPSKSSPLSQACISMLKKSWANRARFTHRIPHPTPAHGTFLKQTTPDSPLGTLFWSFPTIYPNTSQLYGKGGKNPNLPIPVVRMLFSILAPSLSFPFGNITYSVTVQSPPTYKTF